MFNLQLLADVRIKLSRGDLVLAMIRSSLATLAGSSVIRNIGWYSLAEICARLSRLVTTVILARWLNATDFGTAAIAITCFELVRILTNNGLSQLVARASADDLAATCKMANRASKIVCVAIFGLQLAIGGVTGYVSGEHGLAAMIASLAFVYLIMIPGLIPAYLLMREARFKELAAISTLQLLADNALTAALALSGFGAWSVVLPKLLTAPIWLMGVRKCHPWTPDRTAGGIAWSTLFNFSAPILGSEVISALRLQFDKIVVYQVLGAEPLGIYYFSFNAGVGLSLALTNSLSSTIFPELSRVASSPRQLLQKFDEIIMTAALPICAFIGLQSILSFIYVPIIFGSKWTPAAAIVATLCVSAVTKPFADSSIQLLRAMGKTHIELVMLLLSTVITIGALFIGLHFGLEAGTRSYAIAAFVCQGALMLAARSLASQASAASQREPVSIQTLGV